MSAPSSENEEKRTEEAAASEDAAADSEPRAERSQAEGERPGQETRSRGQGDAREGPREPSRGRSFGRRRDRDAGGGRRERRFRRPRRKVCAFCVDKVTHIDYKDHGRLRDFVSDRGKILKSRMTGTCARHQRKVGRAIKRARHVALLPYVAD